MFNLAFIRMNNSTNPTQIIMKIKSVNHDIDIICDAVAVVTKANPMARDRVRENVDARRIVYKVCREMLNLTYIRIAKYFDKNHASVLHGLKHFDALFETDRDFRNNYNAVVEVIGSVEFDSNIIDSQDILVDYVNLKSETMDIKQKYEMLLRSLSIKVDEKLDQLFMPIHNDLLHKLIQDDNCSRDLKKTLGNVLQIKIKNTNLTF
jgi:hypothetical protein|tara:strand:- start:1689 stop:2309 length:621 start_codon:yes stop_codon:yes gene_type:complete